MANVSLPTPVVRPAAARSPVDVAALARDLRARVDGEVRFDAGSRAAYFTDASNYRQVPLGVVVPRTVDAAVEAVAVCREHGAPLLGRGGGTSLAGECTNAAVVLDFSKYCTRLLAVDVAQRTCVVEPGIVLDELNRRLTPYGLEFGPEPATHSRCTLGGMIGNNSCGATAQRTGKTVDNVAGLDVLLYDGTRMQVGVTDDAQYQDIVRTGGRRADVHRQLRDLRDRYAEEIRRRYPDIPRRVSGYNLDSLLPEHGFDVAGALVGSEGTCVVVLGARLRLVPVVPARALVLLGYTDVVAAARDVPAILEQQPIALEGFDVELVESLRRKQRHTDALRLLPDGPGGWLLVQFGGADADADEAGGRAARFGDEVRGQADPPTVTVIRDEQRQQQLWRVREAALGVAARAPGRPDGWPGWEDSAVAPERLADYLHALKALFAEFGYPSTSVYGHFGQGCVHARIPFDLLTAGGVREFRRFVERAADLVVDHGGSLSGEHGDGQARAELLPKMFGANLVRAFGEFKAVFDPDNRMNPGKLADPYPLDEHLRLGAGYEPRRVRARFGYPDDGGRFDRAVQRCVGVGQCRRHEGGVMCPSYMVTREEEQSTRGRARLLHEMLQGHPDSPITNGWRSTAVRDALDLCLACKGCKADCPVNVDMATYKAEFLSHHYAGRLRPRTHYSMGWLPVLATAGRQAPWAVNALTQTQGLAALAKAAGGIAQQRQLPRFAGQSFTSWCAARGARGGGERGEVVLWPDTFTNSFAPQIGRAAVQLLEDAGWRPIVPRTAVCCGLTWISTGQLGIAKRMLRRTLRVLAPQLRQGTLLVGLEPSCTAVFRSDATELFPGDPDVERLRAQTVTLAELLVQHTPGWEPPRRARPALMQTHCHQHAVMGIDADVALLDRAGVDLRVLDSGCCGLAGNFGFEAGHYDVSVACAERVLLPEVRSADSDVAVLADGFSCRTQIEQGNSGGRTAVHLAQLLAESLPD